MRSMYPMMTESSNCRKMRIVPDAVPWQNASHPERGYDLQCSPIAAESARSPLTWVQKVIEVNVNGAAQRFEPDTDIAALLERLQLAGKRVAVERNGEIVPRSRFAQTALANGDRLEIVVAVGGG